VDNNCLHCSLDLHSRPGTNYKEEEVSAKIREKYCVIGRSVTTGIGRNWFVTEEEASEHAVNLIRNKDIVEELYVVRITKVARKAYPPIEVVEVE
jgi:hypothetical protein